MCAKGFVHDTRFYNKFTVFEYALNFLRFSHKLWGGGGVPTTKKIMPPGKPKMSFVFFVLFQNTFKIDVFVSNLVKNVSSKKNKKDHDFRIF